MILHDATIHFEPATRPHRALRAGEVHLWMITLAPTPSSERTSLSNEEWLRSARFVSTQDGERYITSRVRLRQILATYLREDPACLSFTRGPHGKPALSGEHGMLRFNLSHADDTMLLAVTHGREVGVDLEGLRDNVHHEMLAEHYFSPEDQWALRIAPEQERARKFFELWTVTEARLKALGLGLNENPNRFAGAELALRSFAPRPGYAGAVAVEGRDFELACWQWQN
jgi:4'-phosphopantetheinyl transferase